MAYFGLLIIVLLHKIPFNSLVAHHASMAGEIEAAIQSVVSKNWFVQGSEVKAFEQELANTSGTRYAIGTGNGLDALTFALLSIGVGPGDEVIVPAHTYIATWLAVSRTGAKPVPVEPEIVSMNLDSSLIRTAITGKTKAILPVHLYGQACDMTSIVSVAAEHELVIIEDNAQALGSTWEGKPTGSWGMVNATSFYPTKNLGAMGDGGAITTDDEDIAMTCWQLCNYGFVEKNVAVRLGYNSRLDEIQAAILRVKRKYFSKMIDMRRDIATMYVARLSDIGDLILPVETPGAFHTYHLFALRTNYRDQLKEYLAHHGIETQVHYPVPPHLQQAYSYLDLTQGCFPVSEKIATTALSLPIWPGMTETQITEVCDVIRLFFNRHL